MKKSWEEGERRSKWHFTLYILWKEDQLNVIIHFLSTLPTSTQFPYISSNLNFCQTYSSSLKLPPEIGWCIRKNKNKIWKYFAKSKYSLCQWCTFNLDLILYNYVPFTIIYIMLQQRKRTTRMLWGRKISCDISVTKFSSSYFLYVATWH